MRGAQSVETFEKIAGGVGVVPVVATVVDGHEKAGFLRQHASVFDHVVAGEQDLEDGIAKGAVFAGHGGGGGDAAGEHGIGWTFLGKNGGRQVLLPGDSGRSSRSKKVLDLGGKLVAEAVFVDDEADVGDGGVVGRSGAGGERVERAQRHVGQQQGDFGRVRRGDGQAPAFDRGEVLAQGVDFADGRARSQQGLVEGHGVFEAELRVEGQVEHGRAAAGDEEEDEGIFAGLFEQRERGAGGGEGVLVGQRMAALEVAECASCACWAAGWCSRCRAVPCGASCCCSSTSSMGSAALPRAMTKMRL